MPYPRLCLAELYHGNLRPIMMQGTPDQMDPGSGGKWCLAVGIVPLASQTSTRRRSAIRIETVIQDSVA
jgi:hypothetical protein